MSARGFTVRAHPAGLWALLAALLFGRADVALAAVAALAWHEGAHLLCMRLCGVRRCDVELTPLGGTADAPDFERLSCSRQVLCALAGVTASALMGWICLRFAPVRPFWHAMANLNLSLALVNCLPVWPLDGARAVAAIAARFGRAGVALRLMRWLAFALALAMVALGVWGAWRGIVNPTLFLVGPYLAHAARESALYGGMRLLRCADEAERKLRGGPVEVRALALPREPDAQTLTRMLSRMPQERYHVLCVLDESGDVRSVLGERRLARRALGLAEDDKPTT